MKPQNCIFFRLAKANQSAGRFWKNRLSSLRITTVQGMLLMFLVDKDNITSAELGKRVKLDSATLTGLINRLESLELVERRKDREDRRAVRICLTPSGRDLGMRVTEITAKAHHEFLSGQNPESEQQLIHFIDQLSDRGF